MPWPFLPPDPDIPAPVVASPGGGRVAIPLTLRGMSPFDEQSAHAFYVDGRRVSVFMQHALSEPKHLWSGVCVAPVRARSRVGLKVVYEPQGEVKGVEADVRVQPHPAKITAVNVGRSGTKALFTVHASALAAGEFQVVAVPDEPKPPVFSSPEAYAAAGGWAALSSAGKAQIVVRPGRVRAYALYVVQGTPAKQSPGSAVRGVRL